MAKMPAAGAGTPERSRIPAWHRRRIERSEPVEAMAEAGKEAEMWLEAILSKDDLTKLVERLFPVKIDLGGGTLALHDPSEISLVPERGLLIHSKALVDWPVLGIEVPIALHELSVLICPEVVVPRDTLAFRLEIVHADLAGVPNFVDVRITERINRTLRERNAELTWDFARTLSHVFHFPDTFSLAEGLSLDVGWGRLRINDEAIVMAVSFRADILREAAEPARAAQRAATSG